MKQKILEFLENKYVDNFLIGLIILNFIVFVFQTDIGLYNYFKIYINKFEFISIIIFTFEYILRVVSIERFRDIFKPMMIIDFSRYFHITYHLSQ